MFADLLHSPRLIAAAFLVVAALITPSVISQRPPECIKYEIHESASARAGQAQVLARNCFSVDGFLDAYSSTPFARIGPVTFNTTFDCCVNKTCTSDLECPFNFLCNLGQQRCIVAHDCELSDEVDYVLNEGTSCLIDDDCAFNVPGDEKSWKCIAAPCTEGSATCLPADKCKRCSKALPSRLASPRPSILLTTLMPPTGAQPMQPVSSTSSGDTVATAPLAPPTTVSSSTNAINTGEENSFDATTHTASPVISSAESFTGREELTASTASNSLSAESASTTEVVAPVTDATASSRSELSDATLLSTESPATRSSAAEGEGFTASSVEPENVSSGSTSSESAPTVEAIAAALNNSPTNSDSRSAENANPLGDSTTTSPIHIESLLVPVGPPSAN